MGPSNAQVYPPRVKYFRQSLIKIVPRNGIRWANKNFALSTNHKDVKLLKHLDGADREVKTSMGMDDAFCQMYSRGWTILERHFNQEIDTFLEVFHEIQQGVDGFANVPLLLFVELFFAALAGRTEWEDERETYDHNYHLLSNAAKQIDTFTQKMGEARMLSIKIDYENLERETLSKLKTQAQQEEAWAPEPSHARTMFILGGPPRAPQPVSATPTLPGPQLQRTGQVPRGERVAVSMIWPGSQPESIGQVARAERVEVDVIWPDLSSPDSDVDLDADADGDADADADACLPHEHDTEML